MFAPTSLAARIERAECRLLADSAAAAARRHPETRVFSTPLGGGVATYTLPGAPLNKVAGLGFSPLEERDLGAVERAFAERGSPAQAEVSTLGDPAIVRTLTGRGYRLQGFENVLGRRLPAGPVPRPEGVAVLPSPVEELDAWIDVVTTGFASPDEQGVPSHESHPQDLGCGAATLSAHRRRGVQTALLARRLEVAAEAGCDVAVVVTQPGSKSQENVQRQGFHLLCARAVLVREP